MTNRGCQANGVEMSCGRGAPASSISLLDSTVAQLGLGLEGHVVEWHAGYQKTQTLVGSLGRKKAYVRVPNPREPNIEDPINRSLGLHSRPTPARVLQPRGKIAVRIGC